MVFVDERNSQGLEREMFGQEGHPQSSFRVDIADSSQRLGVALQALGGVELDGMFATQAGDLRDRPRLDDVFAGVALDEGGEKCARDLRMVQARRIEV